MTIGSASTEPALCSPHDETDVNGGVRWRCHRRTSRTPVDVETTGIYYSTNNVIEVAIVHLDEDFSEVGSWTTLVNPDRDLGLTDLHGISGRDVKGAPKFSEVAEELLWLLADNIVVAHNARFDRLFIEEEVRRSGLEWDSGEFLCTMTLAEAAGVGRSLAGACEALGVQLSTHHEAVEDARATAGVLRSLLASHISSDLPRAQARARPASPAPIRHRADPPLPRTEAGVTALSAHVGVPATVGIEPEAASSYLALLDRVLEDRMLDADESIALARVAASWGIGESQAAELHRAYIAETWALARADGFVTRDERQDIEILAELLGVPEHEDAEAGRFARVGRSVVGDYAGKTVCFTGATRCWVGGRKLERADLQRYAEQAGLVVKSNVSSRLDLLVVADPDTRSGKAKKADDLGVRKMFDAAFLRSLGVACDVRGKDDLL